MPKPSLRQLADEVCQYVIENEVVNFKKWVADDGDGWDRGAVNAAFGKELSEEEERSVIAAIKAGEQGIVSVIAYHSDPIHVYAAAIQLEAKITKRKPRLTQAQIKKYLNYKEDA